MKRIYTAGPTCYEGCLASILEIEPAQIPDLRGGEDWSVALRHWLCGLGWKVSFFSAGEPRGFSIVSYRTDRGAHAVVCLDGQPIHDPSGGQLPRSFQPLLWTTLEKI
jgi:hypothetical protein